MDNDAVKKPGGVNQTIDSKIIEIISQDKDIKTGYNELRTIYSVICNDIKSAIFKRLSVSMSNVRSLDEDNFAPKFFKKDPYLLQLETNLNDQLEKAPEINAQNLQATLYFLRDLAPALTRLKAKHANDLKTEKKVKKARVLQGLVQSVDFISLELHNLSIALNDYLYFENFTLALIRARHNKDLINVLIKEFQTVVKQLFKTGKNEVLDINILRVINLLTIRTIIRLSILEYSGLYPTFAKIKDVLPAQLVKQFNVRYAARKRDKQELTDDVKKSAAYLNITRKFVTLKLEKFNELQSAYVENLGRLIELDERMSADFTAFLGKMGETRHPDTRRHFIEEFQNRAMEKLDLHSKTVSSLAKDEDYAKISLKMQFRALIIFYYNILKDNLAPQSLRELSIKYMKIQKPPKEMMMSGAELKLLEHGSFSRKNDILKIFYDGISSLVLGKDDESDIVDALIDVIGLGNKSMRSDDKRHRAIQEFVDTITPDEIDKAIEVLDILPPDRQRMGIALGGMFKEIFKKYPESIKWKVDHLEKIEPTDSDIEKLRKTTTEKLNKLFLKAVGFQTERPAPVTILQGKEEEEKSYLDIMREQADLEFKHEVNSLITFWKLETDRSVVDFCFGKAKRIVPTTKTKEFNKTEIRTISNRFNSEYLIDIEKHYKTLNESIGPQYLKAKKPYFKAEFIMLFAAKALLMSLRRPDKSYPRLHERIAAIFGEPQ